MIIEDIRDIRKSNGITLKQLAELTGTSYSRLSNIENGKDNPSLDILERISSALGAKLTIIKDSD